MPASSTTPKTPRHPRDGARSATAAIDGAARGNPGPAGAGAILKDARGAILAELSVFLGETTNNVAEYAALLCALQEAARLGIRDLNIQTDSELLARQMDGAYRVKDPTLRVLHALARQGVERFARCALRHVPREQNRAADRLANRAVDAGVRRGTAKRPAAVPPDPSQGVFPF